MQMKINYIKDLHTNHSVTIQHWPGRRVTLTSDDLTIIKTIMHSADEQKPTYDDWQTISGFYVLICFVYPDLYMCTFSKQKEDGVNTLRK